MPTFTIVSQYHFFLYSIQFDTIPDSCLLSPPPKHRHHGHRFEKWAKLNSAAIAVLGSPRFLSASLAGFSSAGLAVFLSAGFADFSEPAAAASAPSGNLIRNCVEFYNFG